MAKGLKQTKETYYRLGKGKSTRFKSGLMQGLNVNASVSAKKWLRSKSSISKTWR